MDRGIQAIPRMSKKKKSPIRKTTGTVGTKMAPARSPSSAGGYGMQRANNGGVGGAAELRERAARRSCQEQEGGREHHERLQDGLGRRRHGQVPDAQENPELHRARLDGGGAVQDSSATIRAAATTKTEHDEMEDMGFDRNKVETGKSKKLPMRVSRNNLEQAKYAPGAVNKSGAEALRTEWLCARAVNDDGLITEDSASEALSVYVETEEEKETENVRSKDMRMEDATFDRNGYDNNNKSQLAKRVSNGNVKRVMHTSCTKKLEPGGKLRHKGSSSGEAHDDRSTLDRRRNARGCNGRLRDTEKGLDIQVSGDPTQEGVYEVESRQMEMRDGGRVRRSRWTSPAQEEAGKRTSPAATATAPGRQPRRHRDKGRQFLMPKKKQSLIEFDLLEEEEFCSGANSDEWSLTMKRPLVQMSPRCGSAWRRPTSTTWTATREASARLVSPLLLGPATSGGFGGDGDRVAAHLGKM